ncbi:hypothetical protein A2U01_0106209, partial [Trifolium medium]|nr:hypothetical protein [Trifolium medium]
NPVVKSFENTADEANAVEDAATSNVQTNLETAVVPESPEMAICFDKQKDSDKITIGNVSKESAGVYSHSDEA